MWRFWVVALLAAGCGASGSSAARETTPEASALPRAGACVRFREPGMSNPSPGVECVPPRELDVAQSASRRMSEGDYLGAGDCFAAAYEAQPTEPTLALGAARAYGAAGRAELARPWYERALAEATTPEMAAAARDGLAELDAR